jgi:hypothetical protein
LEEALHNFGSPEIFNTDQSNQFTSDKLTEVLKDHDITISMDSRVKGFHQSLKDWTKEFRAYFSIL